MARYTLVSLMVQTLLGVDDAVGLSGTGEIATETHAFVGRP
jgi:hypothetical protein